MVRISKGRKDGEPSFTFSDKFNRGIGMYSSGMYTVTERTSMGQKMNIEPISPRFPIG